jgi:pimeloyl-ACP methyl ester carboxylesterase
MYIADSEAPLSIGYDLATRDDTAFTERFPHRFRTVDGLQMHYILGGDGPALVVLHGIPETWLCWRPIIPALADTGHTVIAIDLPGLGDTTGTVSSHDKATLARYAHKLLVAIGFAEGVRIVGHDFGAAVALALCLHYRRQFTHLLMMDFPITGTALTWKALQPLSFHLGFHSQEPLFEQLVTGRERLWLNYLYPHLSPGNPQPIASTVVDDYVRAYSRPGALRHASRYYQSWPQDEADIRAQLTDPLTIAVHLMAQEALFDSFFLALREAAPHATGVAMPTGHWMVHEAPRRVLAEITNFLQRS